MLWLVISCEAVSMQTSSAHPNHLDVVTFRNQRGDVIYALLSEDAERDLLNSQ
jgi:hypothetical protein